jgi:hypothetical protein
MLFERFQGLPPEGFAAFANRDRESRRRAIIDTLHPALERLGGDLLERLAPRATRPLHQHLPRLDWPRGYQPFCTWLALSQESHGYQAGPQLNLGVHPDHVDLRLGWDTAADAFGRFEFLCRHGELGGDLVAVAERLDLRFRVYAPAPWPKGSERVFESPGDVAQSFEEVRRRGVWWELGRRHDLPGARDHVCSPALGREAALLFEALLPIYERCAAS